MDASLSGDKLAGDKLAGDKLPVLHRPKSRTAISQEPHVNLDNTPIPATLTLGPFRVGADGTLEPMVSDPAPKFTCRWRRRVIHARLLPADALDWRLELSAPLGRVPSSVGAPAASRRSPSFTLMRDLPATLPDGWRIGLAADHRVLLEAELSARLPMTATALISEITGFLLTLAPYLDVLEETGLTVPSDPVGAAIGVPGGTLKT
jgi:hypothetical protein